SRTGMAAGGGGVEPLTGGEVEEDPLQVVPLRSELTDVEALPGEQLGDAGRVVRAAYAQQLTLTSHPQPRLGEHSLGEGGVGHADPHRRGAEPAADDVGDGALGEQPAAPDDGDGVGDLLDLGQDVAGDQD